MKAALKTSAAVVAFAMSLVASQSALAATDGTVGATSTGTSNISVNVPDLIRISGLADLALGSYSGSGDMSGADDICVYTNKAPGNYFVTASGSGAANAFTITNGTNTIAYNVFFNDTTGTSGEVSLASGVKSAQQTGANTTSASCGGSSSANFHVVVPEANIQAAPAGSYSGTLTLVVEPA